MTNGKSCSRFSLKSIIPMLKKLKMTTKYFFKSLLYTYSFNQNRVYNRLYCIVHRKAILKTIPILSGFSSFLCSDRTFKYNNWFMDDNIENFVEYTEAMFKRIKCIIQHFNHLSHTIESGYSLVYDSMFIFSCTPNKQWTVDIYNKDILLKTKKSINDSYELRLLSSDSKKVIGAFEIKNNEIINFGAPLKELTDKISSLI